MGADIGVPMFHLIWQTQFVLLLFFLNIILLKEMKGKKIKRERERERQRDKEKCEIKTIQLIRSQQL